MNKFIAVRFISEFFILIFSLDKLLDPKQRERATNDDDQWALDEPGELSALLERRLSALIISAVAEFLSLASSSKC